MKNFILIILLSFAGLSSKAESLWVFSYKKPCNLICKKNQKQGVLFEDEESKRKESYVCAPISYFFGKRTFPGTNLEDSKYCKHYGGKYRKFYCLCEK